MKGDAEPPEEWEVDGSGAGVALWLLLLIVMQGCARGVCGVKKISKKHTACLVRTRWCGCDLLVVRGCVRVV